MQVKLNVTKLSTYELMQIIKEYPDVEFELVYSVHKKSVILYSPISDKENTKRINFLIFKKV